MCMRFMERLVFFAAICFIVQTFELTSHKNGSQQSQSFFFNSHAFDSGGKTPLVILDGKS